MACFIVPGTEAIVTTAITKIVEKKEKKEICSCGQSSTASIKDRGLFKPSLFYCRMPIIAHTPD